MELCKSSPIGVDRNNRSYWILIIGTKCRSRRFRSIVRPRVKFNFTFFYDTIELLDTLISSLKQQSNGRKEKELLKELSETLL